MMVTRYDNLPKTNKYNKTSVVEHIFLFIFYRMNIMYLPVLTIQFITIRIIIDIIEIVYQKFS